MIDRGSERIADRAERDAEPIRLALRVAHDVHALHGRHREPTRDHRRDRAQHERHAERREHGLDLLEREVRVGRAEREPQLARERILAQRVRSPLGLGERLEDMRDRRAGRLGEGRLEIGQAIDAPVPLVVVAEHRALVVAGLAHLVVVAVQVRRDRAVGFGAPLPEQRGEPLLVSVPQRAEELEGGRQLLAGGAGADERGPDVPDHAGIALALAMKRQVPVRGERVSVAHGVLRAEERHRIDVRRGWGDDGDGEVDRVRREEPLGGLRGEVAPRIGDVDVELEAPGRGLRHGVTDAQGGLPGGFPGGTEQRGDGFTLEALGEDHGASQYTPPWTKNACAKPSSCWSRSAAT